MNSAARRGRRTARGYGRLVAWLVSGALLIAFASYVALPFGLGSYLPRLAAQYGIDLDVKQVRVAPFASRLRLSGVRIATTGDSSIEWSSVEARVDLAELLSGRLVLDGFRLSEAKLHAGGPGAEAAGPLPDVPAALPEALSVGELVIDEIELASMSETFGRPVAIDWLRISSLDDVFRPGGAEIEADVSIGKGSSRLRGRLAVDAADWNLDAEVDASDVPLDGLPALLGADGSWSGRLGGSGPLRLVYAPGSGAFSATISGRWAVDGPEIGFADARISGARADWNGAAFVTVSDDAVDALSAGVEIGLREVRVEVDDALQIETAELMLRIDASGASGARLSVEGRSPVMRASGQGEEASEAIDAEATNLVSQVAVTFGDGDGAGIEVERLAATAFAANLPEDRSIDLERIVLDRVVVEPGTNAVSAAAATAERAGWQGFSAPGSSGTATRLALQRIEGQGIGGFRIALASVEAAEDRNGDSILRLHDTVLDSAALSPAGTATAGGVRIAEAWLESGAGTLILERLSLDGLGLDEGGAVRIASGRIAVADHAVAGGRVVGSGLEITGAVVSGGAWEAAHVQLGRADVDTGAARAALHEFTLVDVAGEGGGGAARRAWLGKLEHESGGDRTVLEGLHAQSPAWRDGAGNARAIEVASVTAGTLGRRSWESSGWHLTGVEAVASGRASAETVSLGSLGLHPAEDSTAGAQRIALDGLTFDGESTLQVASALAERAYYRADDGTGVDVAGLSADALEWSGEALAAEQGAAPLLSVTAAPVRASFDTVAFTSARLGADGMRELGSVTSASGRGHVEFLLDWSVGALALVGYHAPASGATMLDSVEMHDVDVLGSVNEARLRAGRLMGRGARVEPSGAMIFENAGMEGVTLNGARAGADTGRARTSARVLEASPLAIRESGVEIGALRLSGLETTIGVDEYGGWELPALPVGAGAARSSSSIRIEEASTADPGSIVRLIDRTTEPDFTASVEVTSATLHGFDSGAGDVPARFFVEAASAGVFTALQAGGVLTPTLTGTDLDLNATIRGLSLRELSPYSRLHLGREIEGGQAEVLLDVTVRTSDLEGVADLALSELALGRTESPAGSPGAGPVEPPALDAALESLQGEQGRIELKVPLRGQLDAPGFDLDGVVTRAFAGAALATAQSLPKAE